MNVLADQFKKWIDQNQLLYINLVKPKDGRKQIWGRVVKFDESQGNLLVYHDDEKKIYFIMLNEIEEIIPSSKKQQIEAKRAPEKNTEKTSTHSIILQEVQKLTQSMTTEELVAILPLLRHFNQNHKYS